MTDAQLRYRHYLASHRWKVLRWLRKLLDVGRCRECGATQRLEVHHLSYDNRGGSFIGELMDCRTLCRKHHEAAHNN